MASVQQQAPVAQNGVEEMTKEAQSLLTKSINDGALKEQVCIVAGSMMNATTLPLKLDQTHDYVGLFVVTPSANIESGHTGVFVQKGIILRGTNPAGSAMGAVVYTEKEIPVMWRKSYLLAWDVPNTKTLPYPKNKVYVECGPAGKFDKVDWNEIEMKLKASSYKSAYADKESKGYVTAAIDPVGDQAKLSAVFTELIKSSADIGHDHPQNHVTDIE